MHTLLTSIIGANQDSGGVPPVQGTFFTPIPDVGDGYSTTTGVGADMIPVSGYYNYAIGVWIITSAEMGSAKQLTGMQFRQEDRSGDYSYTMQNQYIKIAHTTDSVLPSGTLNPTGSTPATMSMSNHLTLTNETLVHDGSWALTDGSAGSWSPINFNTSNFIYNGTDNVVVFWVSNWGNWSGGYLWHSVDESSAACVSRGGFTRADYTVPTSLTFTRKDLRPVMRFDY